MTGAFQAKRWRVPVAVTCVALAALATGSHLVQSIVCVGVALFMIPIAVSAAQHCRIDRALALGLAAVGVLSAIARARSIR